MESKHSRGPWTLGGLDGLEISSASVGMIATVNGSGAQGEEREANARVLVAAPDLVDAARAAIAYDEAIRSAANDPEKMQTVCTTQGEDLDTLYDRWVSLSRAALSKVAA